MTQKTVTTSNKLGKLFSAAETAVYRSWHYGTPDMREALSATARDSVQQLNDALIAAGYRIIDSKQGPGVYTYGYCKWAAKGDEIVLSADILESAAVKRSAVFADQRRTSMETRDAR